MEKKPANSFIHIYMYVFFNNDVLLATKDEYSLFRAIEGYNHRSISNNL